MRRPPKCSRSLPRLQYPLLKKFSGPEMPREQAWGRARSAYASHAVHFPTGQSSCGIHAFFATKQRQSEHCDPRKNSHALQWPMRSLWSGPSTVLNPEATKRAREAAKAAAAWGGSMERV